MSREEKRKRLVLLLEDLVEESCCAARSKQSNCWRNTIKIQLKIIDLALEERS